MTVARPAGRRPGRGERGRRRGPSRKRRMVAARAATWWHSCRIRDSTGEGHRDDRDTPAAGRDRAGIEGRTICDHLRETAENSGDAPALSDQAGDGTGWQTLTWAQARQQVLELAAGLRRPGPAPGRAGGAHAAQPAPSTCWPTSAAVHAGGIPVTFYATLAADQIGYVAGDCDARIAVLDGAAELARWEPMLDRLPGAEEDHRQGRGRLPGRGPVPDLGRPRRAGQGAARRRPGTGHRADRGHQAGGPGHPAVHLGHHRQPQGRAAHPPQRALRGGGRRRRRHCVTGRTCAGCPTCRWPTSPSGCSASTCRSAPPATSTSARTATAADRGGRARCSRPRSSACPGSGRRSRPASRRCWPSSRTRPSGRRSTAAMDTGRRYVREPPVRQRTTPRPGRGVRRGRRGRCSGRSGRCSASARPRSVLSAAAPLPPEVARVLRRARHERSSTSTG